MAGVLEKDKYGIYSWAPVAAMYYKEGTLVLDVRDSQKKLIWRGWATRLLGTSPEGIARDIRHAVDDILKKFPPRAAPSPDDRPRFASRTRPNVCPTRALAPVSQQASPLWVSSLFHSLRAGRSRR